MEWPIGRIQPRDVVEVDPRFGDVLIREGFARAFKAASPAAPPKPKAPTVPELRAYASKHGLTLIEARDALAAEIRDRAAGAHTEGAPA